MSELLAMFEQTYSVRYSAAELQEHPLIQDNLQVFNDRKSAQWDGFILAARLFGKVAQ